MNTRTISFLHRGDLPEVGREVMVWDVRMQSWLKFIVRVPNVPQSWDAWFYLPPPPTDSAFDDWLGRTYSPLPKDVVTKMKHAWRESALIFSRSEAK